MHIQLQMVNDSEGLRELLASNEYDFRYDAGVAQPCHAMSLADRDTIVQSLATHYTIIQGKAELDQIVEGLDTLHVLELIRSNPRAMRPLFVHAESVPLTADVMIDMFSPKLSPVGANRRELEEAAVMHWVNYIQLIESEFITCTHYLCLHIPNFVNCGWPPTGLFTLLQMAVAKWKHHHLMV